MKKIFFKGFILALLTLSFSCDSYLEGTNENPNDPTAVSASALLTPAELTIAFEYNSNFARFSGMLVQHVEGVARQSAGFNNYQFDPANFDTDWGNLYVDVLQNLNIMITNSNENGHNHYVGVGQALKAFTLLLMTDYWNDIPYTEAFNGVENLQPAYDSQNNIYEEIHSLLAQARQNLNSNDGGLALQGDLIYSNDTSKWVKATHAIEARAYLHRAKLDNANYTSALGSIDMAFTSSAGDFKFPFGNAATTASPWYQWNRDRGDIGFNPTMNNALTALNDPRLDIYDGDGESLFGEVFESHEFFTIDKAVDLVTFTELMFAKAECLLATDGSQADILEAYHAGIQSSFSSLGLDDDFAAYTAQASVSPATITLEEVMTQKWIALYGNPESFSDWRRTNIPALTSNTSSEIPRRFLYPESEVNLNKNTPSASLTDRVDWDN